VDSIVAAWRESLASSTGVSTAVVALTGSHYCAGSPGADCGSAAVAAVVGGFAAWAVSWSLRYCRLEPPGLSSFSEFHRAVSAATSPGLGSKESYCFLRYDWSLLNLLVPTLMSTV
jgi:hypothetical protein